MQSQAKLLQEHFLEQIKNKERLTFTSRDADKIIMKAKQNETYKGTNRKPRKWFEEY